MSGYKALRAGFVLVSMMSSPVLAQPITQVHGFYGSLKIPSNADSCVKNLVAPASADGIYVAMPNRYYYRIQRGGLGYIVTDPFALAEDYGAVVIACQPSAASGTQALVFSTSTNRSWADIFKQVYVTAIGDGKVTPPKYDTQSLGTGQQVPVDVGGLYTSVKNVNDEVVEAIQALSKAGLAVSFDQGFVFGQGPGVRVLVSIVPFNANNSISGITPIEADIAKTTVLVVTAATSQASAHSYLKTVVNNITRTTIPPEPARIP